jgi:uncharacterized protein YigE (DUF2233 family)
MAGSSWAQPESAWDQLLEGLAVLVWTPEAKCRHDVPPLYVVKIDPERFRFSTYQYRAEGLSAPLTLPEWQRQTKAALLVNAGLFREDYSYLGLLFKNGRSIGSRRHAQWQGLFVAEPTQPGLRKARVLDLSTDSFAEAHPVYREAAQSLMLLDHTGKPRVRQSEKRAYQTVVAEDGRDGTILLMKTTGEVTLRALAECLRDHFASVRQAMAMDGGDSSDLLISGAMLPSRADGGRGRPWSGLVEGGGQPHIPLPAVIAVFPRER